MNRDKTKQLLSLPAILALITSFGLSNAFAETTDDFIAITNDSLKDPLVAKILENIEKSKKEFADMNQQNEQQKILDEQRNIANNILQQELEQMFKNYEDFTPLSAFKNFLATVSNDDTKTIFQGLFDYHQNKVNAARDAMHNVLRNGGSLQEARDAYHDTAKIPRADMIQLVKDLNIEVGFSDPSIQDNFNKDGKLPRYEDAEESALSFVDYTSHAENVNSSDSNEKNAVNAADTTDNADTTDEISKDSVIQKLLAEIQGLKNKIKELENNQNVQKAFFEKTEASIFADWVSNYVPGNGPGNHQIITSKQIPVNVLNEPNSYDDEYHSLALGRNGQVTVGFSESVTGKLILYEVTKENMIREKAIVEVSRDGNNWIELTQTQYNGLNSNVHEYAYDLTNVGCITHVRITDATTFAKEDGFDLDALGATQRCTNSS